MVRGLRTQLVKVFRRGRGPLRAQLDIDNARCARLLAAPRAPRAMDRRAAARDRPGQSGGKGKASEDRQHQRACATCARPCRGRARFCIGWCCSRSSTRVVKPAVVSGGYNSPAYKEFDDYSALSA